MNNMKRLPIKTVRQAKIRQGITSNDPSFIIDSSSKGRKIVWCNHAAFRGYDMYDPIGKLFDQMVHVEESILGFYPALFHNKWYKLKQESVLWRGKACFKMTLQQRKTIPGEGALKSLEYMIKLLLHRMRSPLTGMQGYTHLMENRLEAQANTLQIGKIKNGIDQLLKLLDDLEVLQKIPREKVEEDTCSANPVTIINEIISDYPADIQKNITFLPPKNTQLVSCSPEDLKRILSLLLENAIEHAPVSNHNICIELPSATSAKISHNGNPIPASIAKKLFFPFVTSKATKLGISLTMAMLYAQRYKGSIFLTDNSLFAGVSFTLCLPPAGPKPAYSQGPEF